MLPPPTPAQWPTLPHLTIASVTPSLLEASPAVILQVNHDIPWVTREREAQAQKGGFLGGGLGNPAFYSSPLFRPREEREEGGQGWSLLTEARRGGTAEAWKLWEDAQNSPSLCLENVDSREEAALDMTGSEAAAAASERSPGSSPPPEASPLSARHRAAS